MEEITYNDKLLDRAIKNLPLNRRNDIPKGGMNEFLGDVVNSFLVEKIKDFPKLCEDARRVNMGMLKFYAHHGNKSPTRMIAGKVYEGTSGWSKDGNFRHRWIVPNQLMFFMRNLIYVDFWADSNAKVRDEFMKCLLRGDDPFDLLKRIRAHYGTNPNPEPEKMDGTDNRDALVPQISG